MGTGVLFAVVATLCGVAVNRGFRAPLSLAPFTGLAVMAIFTVWCAGLGAPGLVSTGGVLVLALAGGVFAYREARNLEVDHVDRTTVALVAAAVSLPALLLG